MTTNQTACDEFLLASYDLTETTQKWYAQKVGVFIEWCEAEEIALCDLRPSHLRKFLEAAKRRDGQYTGKPITSHTLNGYARVIKTFMKFCAAEGLIPQETTSRILDNVKTPQVDQTVIEVFTIEQIRKLIIATDKEVFARLKSRDRAMIYVLLDTGIRAMELCGLTIDNTHINQPDPYIKVYGKGRKEREVGLGMKAARELRRYIQMHRDVQPGETHVFVGRRREPLTPSGVDQILYRLRDWAHISGVRCSAHTFRHTFAVNYLTNGGDLYMLSRLLGHSDTKTTEIYLRAVKQSQARKTSYSMVDHI